MVILLCTNGRCSLHGRNRTQQVEQVWLVSRAFPAQVQDEWDETIVSNGSGVVQDLVDGLLRLVGECDLIVGHYISIVDIEWR